MAEPDPWTPLYPADLQTPRLENLTSPAWIGVRRGVTPTIWTVVSEDALINPNILYFVLDIPLGIGKLGAAREMPNMQPKARSGVEVRTGLGVRPSWLKLFRQSDVRISHGSSVDFARTPLAPRGSPTTRPLVLCPWRGCPRPEPDSSAPESFAPHLLLPAEVLPLPEALESP